MPKMFDDPKDEMMKGPHGEPDGDEMDIDSLMSEDVTSPGEEDDLFSETPLQQVLTEAGYKVSPEKLSRIQAILSEPEKKSPEKPAGGGMPSSPMAGMAPANLPPPTGKGAGLA